MKTFPLTLILLFFFGAGTAAASCQYDCSGTQNTTTGAWTITITVPGDCTALEPENLHKNIQIVDDCAASVIQKGSVLQGVTKCDGAPPGHDVDAAWVQKNCH